MPTDQRSGRRTAGFSALSVTGNLFPAEFLQTIADRAAEHQAAADYGISKSLDIKDEIARYWRMANDLYASQNSGWLVSLLREVFGYRDIVQVSPERFGERSFPVTHAALGGMVRLVLTPKELSLDRADPRYGENGRGRAPQNLLQEALNADPLRPWGIATNGALLRVVRENPSLTRPAYLQADLGRIFEEELYADFAVLWLAMHASRLEPHDGSAKDCVLEEWRQQAQEIGERALEHLRDGVAEALMALGNGFLENPSNEQLRTGIREGSFTADEFFQQLLRLVYRLLFLFTAEDRDLLYSPNATDEQKAIYREGYSIGRLRETALRRRHYDMHADLWKGLQIVFGALAEGAASLGLLPLGGLFSDDQCETLDASQVGNEPLLKAIRALSYFRSGSSAVRVNYRDMGAEELGSVYESLLEFHPYVDLERSPWTIAFIGRDGEKTKGSARKLTGSYYTPASLVTELIKSALDPVIAQAVAAHSENPRAALLGLRIIDPACGSGHFLLAASRRLAAEVARTQAGVDAPDERARQHALREVVQHCIYGVDRNPLAVELCKAALWIETVEPGKPLTFLDPHIRCGDSLIGLLSPTVMAEGIPNEAYEALSGDDTTTCRYLKKRNQESGAAVQGTLFEQESLRALGAAERGFGEMPEDTLGEIVAKRAVWNATQDDLRRHDQELRADFYVGAFFASKMRDTVELVPLNEDLRRLQQGMPMRSGIESLVRELARQYCFFHWHVEFADIMQRGGFDVVIGNPPWEVEQLVEKEFFAVSAPEIATVRTKAKRTALIARLEVDAPRLFNAWKAEVRKFEASTRFVRNSKVFPLGSAGRINTYRLFAERAAHLVKRDGRSAQVLKSGIVSAEDGQELFQSWVGSYRLVEVREFINTKRIFPDVVPNERFCWLVLTGDGLECKTPTYAFGLEAIEDARDTSRIFSASGDELLVMNPEDRSIPPLSSHRDYLVVLRVHRVAEPLRVDRLNCNQWKVHYTQGHLNASSDSSLFSDNTLEQMRAHGAVLDSREWFHFGEQGFMPLYEGKYIAQLNHRFGTFAGVPESRRFGIKAEAKKTTSQHLRDPGFEVQPRYWLSAADAEERFSEKETEHDWLFGFRDVCRSIVDARTVQACVMPRLPCLNGVPLLVFEVGAEQASQLALLLNAVWGSFAFDYVARQKIHAAHLRKSIAYQLPLPSTEHFEKIDLGYTYRKFIQERSLELTGVSTSLLPFISDVGADGPPFCWDEDRRFLMRCEIDAALFRLYLGVDGSGNWASIEGEPADDLRRLKDYFSTPREAVVHIMDTFQVLYRREAEEYKEYKSKRVILEMYDNMQSAVEAGREYRSTLNPPPADQQCRHPKPKVGILAFGSLLDDPGVELLPRIVTRIKTETPFAVEYGRYSGKTRGGAPTLVPHPFGIPVSAEILVLEDGITVVEATNMLWRRETRRTGTNTAYVEGTSPNSVLVRATGDSLWVESLLYVDFADGGKILNPNVAELADRAVRSVQAASQGMDGISYLKAAIANGIKTALTQAYQDAILRATGADSLDGALLAAKRALSEMEV